MTRIKLPFLTLSIAFCAIIASTDAMQAILQFDRQHASEIWRPVTCHLTHWSTQHLVWDLLVFIALAAVGELRDRKRTCATIAISALAISGVVLCLPNLRFYRGLSGIDSALFMLLCVWTYADARREAQRLLPMAMLAAGLLFALKISVELGTGAAVFVDNVKSGFTPVPAAHLVGAAVGLILAFCSCDVSSRIGDAGVAATNVPAAPENPR